MIGTWSNSTEKYEHIDDNYGIRNQNQITKLLFIV